MDCGVAAFAMILKYYKVEKNQNTIRKELKTTKEGTSAYNIIRGFEKNGFDAKGYKAPLEELKNIKLPAIVHTKIENVNHYIVLYEIKNKYYIIADPATELKKIKEEEFEKIYNGIVITIYPIMIKEEKQVEKSVLKEAIKKTKKEIIILLATTLITTLLALANSYYFMYMTLANDYIKIAMIFLTFQIIRTLFEYLKNINFIRIKNKVDFFIRMDTFRKIIKLPYNYYSTIETGEILSRINDLEVIKKFIVDVSIFIFFEIPIVVGSLILMLKISKQLAIFAIIIFLIQLTIIWFYKEKNYKNINKIITNKATNNSYLEEKISNYESIKALNIEKNIIEEYKNLEEKKHKQIINFDKSLNNQMILMELINNFFLIVLIYLGFKEISIGIIKLPELITFINIIYFFIDPIKTLPNLMQMHKETKICLRALKGLNFQEEGNLKQIPSGKIKIDKLSFSYDGINNVLKNLNTEIEEGEKVLIKGQSGCGKSTLVKILLKYFDDFEGEIKIGNHDIHDYQYEYYRKGITLVSQKEKLFKGKVIKNIGSVDENIIKISRLKKEILEKEIESNDYNISGGERQRIALSRAINQKFNILIIDEGLSELDFDSEKEILNNLFAFYKEKTIIVVSHTENIETLFDKIIEL